MNFFKYMFHEYTKDDLGYLSAQTSYFLLLSFFPFLIFLFTIIGSFHLPANEIYSYLSSILPEQSYTLVYGILTEVLETSSINIVSLLLTLTFATKGVRAIVVALNKTYCEEEHRNIFHLFLLSFVFTIFFIFIFILTLLSLVFGKLIGEILFEYLPIQMEFVRLWEYLRYIITMLFMILVFTFIYKHAPSCNNKLKLKDVMIGSIFTTISWTITSSAFAYYVNNYNNSYASLYGSLGGIFALLVWLYLSSTIIILGGEINSYYYKNTCNQKNKKNHLPSYKYRK